MVLTRAWEQRLSRLEETYERGFSRLEETYERGFSRLEEMIAELCERRGLLMRRNDDDDETDLLYRSEKENPEDQALDDGELVETEVATELNGIEDGTVTCEANAEVISAIVKKEQISQIQVPVSDLEHGLQIHNESPTVYEKSQDVVGCDELCEHQRSILQVLQVKAKDALVTESTSVTINQEAHQLFDVIPLMTKVLPKEHKTRFHKSWRFKFKDKAVSMRFLLGIILGLTKSNASYEQQAVFEQVLMVNEWLQTSLVIEQVMRRKNIKFPKRWMFKYKIPHVDTKVLETSDQCIRKRVFVGADRETKNNQPTLRFLMNTTQSCLTLRANRVWDPGGSNSEKD